MRRLLPSHAFRFARRSVLLACFATASGSLGRAQLPIERFDSARLPVHTFSAILDAQPAHFDHDDHPDLLLSHWDTKEIEVQLGVGDGTFQALPRIALPSFPTCLATGDVDLDGELDVAVAMQTTQDVVVLFGQGGGSLGAQLVLHATTQSGTEMNSCTLADVTGDGKLDLVTSAQTSGGTAGEITLLAGDGLGGFAAPVQLVNTSGRNVFRVELADLTHDGRLDLAFANSSSVGTVEVYLGQVGGSFAFHASVVAASLTRDVVLVDMNDDGDVDLVTYANHGASEAQIFLGDGTGAFVLSDSVVTDNTTGGFAPSRQIAVADFDGDLALDAAFVGSSVRRIAVVRGDGNGQWTTQSLYPAGKTATSIASTDVDSNGIADLVVANFEAHDVCLMLGRGGGAFDVYQPQVGGTGSLTDGFAGDVTGDGRPDILATRFNPGALVLVRGFGNGSFNTPQVFAGSTTFAALAVGDLDADGDRDAVAGGGGGLHRFTNLGAGAFGAQTVYPISISGTNYGALDVQLADVNADGKLDAVAAVATPAHLVTLLGDGFGGFGPAVATSVANGPAYLALGDFDADGWLDVAASSNSFSGVEVFFGDGSGGFVGGVALTAIGPLNRVVASDFDGDGALDLAASTISLPGIVVWLGNGNGTFAASTTAGGGFASRGLITADVDSDTRPDLAVVNYNGLSIGLYLNSGTGVFQEDARFGIPNEFSTSLVAADFDLDGRLDLAALNNQGAGIHVKLQRPVFPTCTGSIQTYCTGKTNSLGCVPIIGTLGAPSASAASGFSLREFHVLNNKSGLFFYSVTGKQAVAFQGGTLCVKLPIKRTPVQNSGGNPPPNDCSGSYTLDFNAWIAGGTDPNLAASVEVFGQFWSRDAGFAPPNNTSLSSAVRFTICP
ncbi:MAG: VCBS repeat-containing protein [Planctomycetes bacterium]|nr:VCBS repeat-containing protein [Planctomycetota bacterium]